MRVDEFTFDLPQNLIAQTRASPYDSSKLLVLNRKNHSITDTVFRNILDYLTSDDVLVFNNTRVFKARLFGKKDTGAAVEVLLLEPFTQEKTTYSALIRGKVHIGTMITFSATLSAHVIHLEQNFIRTIEFNRTGDDLHLELTQLGHYALPPYIKPTKGKENAYQTIYAHTHESSVAAPTAGFHFTKNLLKQIKAKGVAIEFVNLDIGLGTFQNVKTEYVEEHRMHTETYSIPSQTVKRLNTYKQEGKRIIAVGTTAVRTLEDASNRLGVLEKRAAATNIFIYPPYTFTFVDALITNFHLPKSTLLMLVAAFAGKDTILAAYNHAVANNYRFFSFGDAMFIY